MFAHALANTDRNANAGTVWQLVGKIDGVGEAIAKLQQRGKRIVYVTNNSLRSDDEYRTKFAQSGIVANVVSGHDYGKKTVATSHGNPVLGGRHAPGLGHHSLSAAREVQGSGVYDRLAGLPADDCRGRLPDHRWCMYLLCHLYIYR